MALNVRGYPLVVLPWRVRSSTGPVAPSVSRPTLPFVHSNEILTTALLMHKRPVSGFPALSFSPQSEQALSGRSRQRELSCSVRQEEGSGNRCPQVGAQVFGRLQQKLGAG